MRVLAISHSAVAKPYREKWRRLAARKGWELRLILPRRWPEGGAMVEAGDGVPGLDQQVLELRLAGRIGFFSYAGLADAVAAFRPDLLYCEEEPYSLAAFQAARAARRCGAAFVFFSWENIPRRFKAPLNWVRAKVQGMSAGALVGSKESLELYRHWGFLGPSKVIPQYGVDTRLFKPAAPARRRPFCAGYVGRLMPEKGVDLFVRACAKAGVAGLVIGRGPEESRLRVLAQSLGAKVEFRAFVPFEGRHRIYHDLDLLVLPSRSTPRWKEQFGRVIIEAGSSGVPTLGSDSGAIPEVVGPCGVIVPEGDVEALSSALRALSQDRALVRRLGRLARGKAVRSFDSRKLADATGDFLERIHNARS